MNGKKIRLDDQGPLTKGRARKQAQEREHSETQSEIELDFDIQTTEGLHKELQEYNELLLRKQAEFENYRKRVVKERKEAQVEVQARLIAELLPILDAGEKGLLSMETSKNPTLKTYRQGYSLFLEQLKSVLQKFDVDEIRGTGGYFDPSLHEAVDCEVTQEHQEGKILEEYRKGYRIQNRLLRPSQVKVAVNPTEGSSPANPGVGSKAG